MTYYDVLGVPVTATQAEIKRAYIAQIKFFHPDVFTDFPEIAKEKSAQLNEAYSVLSSPEKRAEYDKSVFGSSSNNRYGSHNNADSQSNDAGCHSDNTSPPHHEQSASTESAHEESTSSKSRCENSSSPPPNTPHQNSSERDKEKFFYTVKIVLIELLIIAAVLLLIVYVPKGIDMVTSLFVTEESQLLPQVLPGSGKILDSVFYLHDAPLTIKTQGDGYYLVKLKDKYSHRDVCSVFVYGGRSVNIDVDLGCYELYYAYGDTWYGKEFLFGPDTKYYKADDELVFESDSNYVYGWTVELYLQEDGNLDISPIDSSEF